MIFDTPFFLLLFMPWAGMIYWQVRKQKSPTIVFSAIEKLVQISDKRTAMLSKLSTWVFFGCLALVIIALARPQKVLVEKDRNVLGVDIVLVLDVSPSMKAEDFKPNNRLEVAKNTIQTFISKRTSDRIGLVVFGGHAFTQVPLTLDYNILSRFVNKVTLGMAGNGTAIGQAIASGINRIKNSAAKSKIIILLTDGVNNSGDIDPESAAELAKQFGIKIYSIGIGKEGGAPYKVDHPIYGSIYARHPDGSLVLTEIDEASLKKVSEITLGSYFRAKDKDTLETIFRQIDQLEKTKIKTTVYKQTEELFLYPLWAAFIGLILVGLFTYVFLVRVP